MTAKDDDRISSIIALTVTIVWALSMLVDAYSKTYQPPVYIHASLLSTVGLVLGFRQGQK